MSTENTELSYRELVDLSSSLKEINQLEFPEANVDFYVNLAEASLEVNRLCVVFETAQTAIFKKYCDKKKDGTLDIDNNQYKFSKGSSVKVNDDIEELLSKKVKVKITSLSKQSFKGVKGIKPKHFIGLLPILE